MPQLVIAEDDPAAADVRALLAGHLAFAQEHSPPEDVHALDSEALSHDSRLTFYGAPLDGNPCPPFGDYRVSRNSLCMSLELGG